MCDQISPEKQTMLHLDRGVLESSSYHENIGQEFIITTVDKIRLCLIDYQNTLKAKNDWIVSTGLLVSLFIALVATDFRVFLGLSPDVWEALFIFGSIVSGGWLLYNLYRAIKLRGRGSSAYIIQKIKQYCPVSGQEK